MADHTATIHWRREGATFTDQKYSRGHRWSFDGGVDLPASSSPYVVPLPYSVEAAVDPEEAFIASLSSCHMLWFLSLAAKRGYVVDEYRDTAVGHMGPDDHGHVLVTEVRLQPAVRYQGDGPAPAVEDQLHHEAHEQCFIARSVRTAVICKPLRPAT